MRAKVHRCLKPVWQWIRFGTIAEKVVGDGVPAEIEYRGRGGKVVGYFAYGSYDPLLPYKG